MCEKVKWTSENEKRLHEQAHLGLKDVPLAQDSSYNKQSNDSDSNICSVLLQIFSKGKAILDPGDNKQHALSDIVGGNQTRFRPYCISVAKHCIYTRDRL